MEISIKDSGRMDLLTVKVAMLKLVKVFSTMENTKKISNMVKVLSFNNLVL